MKSPSPPRVQGRTYTLYSVQCIDCTVYSVQTVQCIDCTYRLYSVQCTVYSVQTAHIDCTVYSVQTVHIHCTVYRLYIYTVHCTVYRLYIYTVQCTVYRLYRLYIQTVHIDCTYNGDRIQSHRNGLIDRMSINDCYHYTNSILIELRDGFVNNTQHKDFHMLLERRRRRRSDFYQQNTYMHTLTHTLRIPYTHYQIPNTHTSTSTSSPHSIPSTTDTL